MLHTAGIRGELHDQFIAAHTRKSPWLLLAVICTVREIEHSVVVSAGIFADTFRDKPPLDCTKKAVKTLEESTESQMVQAIRKSHI